MLGMLRMVGLDAFSERNLVAAAAAPALLITSSSYVCDQCGDNGPGLVKMQGFTSWDGYIDLHGYSYTSFVAQSITTTTNLINFNSGQITSVDMRSLVQNGWTIDFLGCPLSSINFDSLQTVAGNHIYLSGAFTTGTSTPLTASFPALTQLDTALVLSRRTGLTSFSAPLLAILNHELELDYTKALATISLPSLTAINGPNGALLAGGDPTDLTGGTQPNALSTLNLPALTTITGLLNVPNCRQLTTVDPSSWTTIANGFGVDFNRCNLTQAVMDAILIKLAAILGSVTSGTVDLRFQFGGQTPSASGQAAAATLVAAGIRNNQGTTALYA